MTAASARAFVLNYVTKTGRERRYTIGQFLDWSTTAARAKAREMFRRFPKAAYMTEIESWRVLPGDRIEFTMRRLPSAD